ncbi:MAG: hypothetical protein Q3996_02150 [Candidatus Saccharibacteria bacterium]|nr:hypothetical protein [Candidatus Saccharibacteria bacterium]
MKKNIFKLSLNNVWVVLQNRRNLSNSTSIIDRMLFEVNPKTTKIEIIDDCDNVDISDQLFDDAEYVCFTSGFEIVTYLSPIQKKQKVC